MFLAVISLVLGATTLFLYLKINERSKEMATSLQELKDVISEMDVETTRIGEAIDDLIGQIENGTISPAQIREVSDPLTARLRALGQPVDPPPPSDV